MRIDMSTDIQQLDPHLVTAWNDYCPWESMFSSLTALDRDFQPVPDLAQSWTQPDPKTYVFQLRKGVLFHNGREMKASDVKFSLERIQGLGGRSKWYTLILDLERVEVVELHVGEQRGPDDAGVVDDDVDALVLGEQPIGDLGGSCGVGDIGGHRAAAERAHHRVELRGHRLDVEADDVGAVASEHLRDRRSDPAGGTGDQRHLAVQRAGPVELGWAGSDIDSRADPDHLGVDIGRAG